MITKVRHLIFYQQVSQSLSQVPSISSLVRNFPQKVFLARGDLLFTRLSAGSIFVRGSTWTWTPLQLLVLVVVSSPSLPAASEIISWTTSAKSWTQMPLKPGTQSATRGSTPCVCPSRCSSTLLWSGVLGLLPTLLLPVSVPTPASWSILARGLPVKNSFGTGRSQEISLKNPKRGIGKKTTSCRVGQEAAPDTDFGASTMVG
jgi:hypothetical protein